MHFHPNGQCNRIRAVCGTLSPIRSSFWIFLFPVRSNYKESIFIFLSKKGSEIMHVTIKCCWVCYVCMNIIIFWLLLLVLHSIKFLFRIHKSIQMQRNDKECKKGVAFAMRNERKLRLAFMKFVYFCTAFMHLAVKRKMKWKKQVVITTMKEHNLGSYWVPMQIVIIHQFGLIQKSM